MSEMRKRYFWKLAGRCVVFALCAVACVVAPEGFGVLEGMNFFRECSWLHVLWVVWMADMLPQILPYPSRIPLGSAKLFAHRFRPGKAEIDPQLLKRFMARENRGAALVFVIWCALLAVIGVSYHWGSSASQYCCSSRYFSMCAT